MTTIDDLAGLLEDAAQVRLPAPRRLPTPRTPQVVIDLTAPTLHRTITIPDTAAGMVEGFTDYGA